MTPYTPGERSSSPMRGCMKLLGATCLSIFVVCCSSRLGVAQQNSASDLESRRTRFREAIAAQWQYQLKTHPEFATYVGDARYNDRFSDFSS